MSKIPPEGTSNSAPPAPLEATDAAPGSDAEPLPAPDAPPRTKATDALINHPDAIKVVVRILAKLGVGWQQMEEAVANVQLEALLVKNPPWPTTVEAWTSRLRDLAKKRGIDLLRKTKTKKAAVNVGPTDLADEHADPSTDGDRLHPLDRAKIAEIILALRESGELTDRALYIADAIGAGTKKPKIAEELGIPLKEVDRDWLRLKQVVRRHAASVGLAALFVAAVILYARGRAPGPVAHDEHPAPPPPKPPEVLVEVNAQEIAKLRGWADEARQAGATKVCLQRLDEADALRTLPAEGPDPLRKQCTDEGIARSAAAADKAIAERNWKGCVDALEGLESLSKTLEPAREAQLKGCRQKVAGSNNSKAP